MSLSKTEKQVILNTIRRLKCEPRADGEYRESDDVRLALTGRRDPYEITGEELGEVRGAAVYVPSLYLRTWVIGALESLLDEEDGGTGRDVKLALDLSR